MEIVRLNATLIEIDGRVRAEQGPRLIETVATLEILSDEVTASHYKQTATPEMVAAAERDVDPQPYPPGFAKNACDKFGRPIVIGQPFAYLDWKAPKEAWPWHVYEFCTEEWTGPNTVVLDESGRPKRRADDPTKFETAIGPAWRRRGCHDTEAEAMVAAGALATTLAGSF